MIDLSEKLKTQRPVKLFRIGEIASFSGISRQTVHNYTTMGLITEDERSSGGHRLYDESVFDALARIERLKKSKTLGEIRRQFNAEQTAERVFSDSSAGLDAKGPVRQQEA